MAKSEKPVALVLGSYINSLSTVRELAPGGMPIWTLDLTLRCAARSRYVDRAIIRDFHGNDEAFLEALFEIGRQLDRKAVLFATHDYHIRIMGENRDILSEYFHVQVNPDSAEKIISKQWQYNLCEEIGIPYPQTFFCETPDHASDFLARAGELKYPLLLKPFSRANDAVLGEAFRAEGAENEDELKALFDRIDRLHEGGFLASEVVPGGPENIWAYTGYCDRVGHVLAGWTGKKLTQRPRDFGVFSTAESHLNEQVERQGITLLEATEHLGIGEPEFKYDARDGKYKLTEVNPRLMMWHICGYFAGVNLPLIQYCHLTGDEEGLARLCVRQNEQPRRLVFMTHELLNILDHHPRWTFVKSAVKSLFLRRKRFGVWWIEDPLPWFTHVWSYFRAFGRKLRGKKSG